MLKKSKHINSVSEHKKLSIQFSLDGFSFCISDNITKEVFSFNQYEFQASLKNPEWLLDTIQDIFYKDELLHDDFEDVLVIHQNNLNSIIPEKLFDENNINSYLNYTIKVLPTDFITFDDIEAINAKNCYIPYVNINNFFFQNFGEFIYNHHATVLIEKLLNYNKNNNEDSFFVHVSKKSIDIVFIENEQLLFFNSFEINSKEDFIYYILFTFEQLKLDVEKNKVTLIGAIKSESDFYEIAYQYIRNIDFLNPEHDFFNDTDNFENHSNYILVS